MASRVCLPTLPRLPVVDELTDRRELRAGLDFIEGASRWTTADLTHWFRANARLLGREELPESVIEVISGAAAELRAGPRSSRQGELARLLTMTRWQVILTLRGLLVRPADDRFLHAAIFAARVRREHGAWRIAALHEDVLSEIVLALFVVDVLNHREFHEQNLCVCEECGRLSYNPRLTTRDGCPEHVPGSATPSGVQERRAGKR